MKCYLGVDAGGSGSRWALLGEDGAFVATGEGPPIQVARLGSAAAAERVEALVRAASAERKQGAKIAAVMAGLAGAGDEGVRQEIRERLGAPGQVVGVTTDIEVAAASALHDGPGIALWAGTGSFAVARDELGRLHRTGGRGYLLGDHGSAYSLARLGAEAVLRASDDLGPPTRLRESLVCSFQVGSVDGLGARLQCLEPPELASRMPLVVLAAEEGDEVALHLVKVSASALVDLVKALIRKAELPVSARRVVLGGGALRSGFYRDELLRQLGALHLAHASQEASLGPAQGAAFLARAWAEGEEPLCSWV